MNAALKDHPEVINKDPHGTWMIKVRLADAGDAGTLLDSAQYQDLTK